MAEILFGSIKLRSWLSNMFPMLTFDMKKNKPLLIVLLVLLVYVLAYQFVSSNNSVDRKNVDAKPTNESKTVVVDVKDSTSTIKGKVPLNGSANSFTAVTDPRVRGLISQQDNPMIEYIQDEKGNLIKELDNDPSSPSFKKPLKLYQFYNGKIARVEKFEYFMKETLVTTIDVALKDDGSVADYRELTRSVESR